MIKFFRKIRQALLSENKFGKYLIYAIGEIVLVVIGILIALSINNWNERGKLKNQEIEILKSIGTELKGNLELTNNAIEVNEGIRKSIEIILSHLEGDKPYHDSLSFHFANTTVYWTATLPSGSYETLKAKGVDIISNSELKERIILFFEWHNKQVSQNSNRYYNLLDNANINIYNTRFESSWNFRDIDKNMSMIPTNYDSLKVDKEYIYFLKSLRGKHYWQVLIPQQNYARYGEIAIRSITENLSKYNR